MGALCLALSLTALCAPAGRPLVNEVLYDAPGDDTGWEFVELWNPAAVAWPLAALRIEAGDGSQPGRWTLRWTGSAADSVRAHGRFVVGGARVVPPADRVVTLDLQNGPDAVRLVWPDGAIEVVGWGTHEFAEYVCGAAAPDAPAGSALARVPDGADSGSNAGDFRIAVPSPGAANQPGRDAALVRGASRLVPERPAAGQAARLEVTLENRGATAWSEGEAVLIAEGVALPSTASWPLPALEAGDSLRLARDLPPLSASKGPLIARVSLAGDEAAASDADTLLVRVGPDPVSLTEVQFHPAAGEGEWIELANRMSEPLSLAGWTLADRSGTRARLVAPVTLAPESLLVLAQARPALLARFAGLDTSRVVAASPWPSLNNSDDSSGVADVIELREADGVLAARFAYSAAGVRTGMPLVWIDGGWRAAEDAGTPLAPPARFMAAPIAFASRSARIAPGGGLELEWSLPWPRARISIELHDLSGRRIATLAANEAAPGRGGRTFTRPALVSGVCVVRLIAADERGGERLSRTLALRLDGPGR